MTRDRDLHAGEHTPNEVEVPGANETARNAIMSVSAVITGTDRSSLVLVERGRNPGKGLWSIPGGKVEPGESLSEAALREVREETNLEVAIGAELWVVTLHADDDRTYEIHCFEARVLGGTLRAGDDAAKAEWVHRDALNEYQLASNLEAQLHRFLG